MQTQLKFQTFAKINSFYLQLQKVSSFLRQLLTERKNVYRWCNLDRNIKCRKYLPVTNENYILLCPYDLVF